MWDLRYSEMRDACNSFEGARSGRGWSMAFILAGSLADALNRLGLVRDQQLSSKRCEAILAQSHSSKHRVETIWRSLDGGLAMRVLEQCGIQMCDPEMRQRFRGPSQPPGMGDVVRTPLVTMVAGHTHDLAIPGVSVRHYSGPLPASSLRLASSDLGFGKDVYVTSPALAYLMGSYGRSVAQVVASGTSLCSTYVKSERGLWPTAYRIPAATDLDGLAAGIGEFESLTQPHSGRGLRGLSTCRLGLSRILEGSGSPIETIVGTFFNLPSSLGGRGFGPVRLNERLDLNHQQQLICGKPYLLLDIVCPIYRPHSNCSGSRWQMAHDGIRQIAIEYDSREYHELVAEVRDPYDRSRAAAAELAGVQLVPLTWEILRDEERFDGFCDQLASVLGIPHRRLSATTIQRRHRTRRELGLPTTALWNLPRTA